MFMKDGTWNIIFTEEISTPQEEYDGNYSYATLNELSVSTFARIRTEALRKELTDAKFVTGWCRMTVLLYRSQAQITKRQFAYCYA